MSRVLILNLQETELAAKAMQLSLENDHKEKPPATTSSVAKAESAASTAQSSTAPARRPSSGTRRKSSQGAATAERLSTSKRAGSAKVGLDCCLSETLRPKVA